MNTSYHNWISLHYGAGRNSVGWGLDRQESVGDGQKACKGNTNCPCITKFVAGPQNKRQCVYMAEGSSGSAFLRLSAEGALQWCRSVDFDCRIKQAYCNYGNPQGNKARILPGKVPSCR